MVKQVIVIRRDLHMRRGKECSQAAYVSMLWLRNRFGSSSDRIDTGTFAFNRYNVMLTDKEVEWLDWDFTKITLQVETGAELLALHDAAVDAKLESNYVVDLGLTELREPTITALAIGPDDSEKIDKITGHLKLY